MDEQYTINMSYLLISFSEVAILLTHVAQRVFLYKWTGSSVPKPPSSLHLETSNHFFKVLVLFIDDSASHSYRNRFRQPMMLGGRVRQPYSDSVPIPPYIVLKFQHCLGRMASTQQLLKIRRETTLHMLQLILYAQNGPKFLMLFTYICSRKKI